MFYIGNVMVRTAKSAPYLGNVGSKFMPRPSVAVIPAAFIGKSGLGRLQPVQDVVRRPLKPGPDMPGQLLGDARHIGGMGLDLMPDADGGDLLPALLELPRARRQLGQGRAVQRDGPDGVFQRLGLVALLLGDVGELQRLEALR